MKTVAMVTPGLRMGMRPERHDPLDRSKADIVWDRWFSYKLSKELSSFKRFSSCLTEIEAAEAKYKELDLARRNSVLLDMRQSLRRRKHSRSDLVKAFALVRFGLQQALGIRLHSEQLYAGWCLYEGAFVEMQTGEGKTLTATLPAITMALAGVPVHIITSNEYLAQRDRDSLEPLYNWFGLKSGIVLSAQNDAARADGYACDITYCTHQQVVFDYLRDSRQLGNQRAGLVSQLHELLQEDSPNALQRGLCFAIVDEADSVLIDDARTPLILAEPVGNDEGAVAEAAVALAIAQTLKSKEHYELDRQTRQLSLTDLGLESIEQQSAYLEGIWKLPRYRDERIVQALIALHLYHKDDDYLVSEKTVVLIDQSTGRPTPQRRLQHGLHRILEVKERCRISEETGAVSALSFQNFFTRYHKLCGMSGTLEESGGELRRVYGPRTVKVPTVEQCKRLVLSRAIHDTRAAQLSAMVSQVKELILNRRAVLIGTRTVNLSEKVSNALDEAGIVHEVLNARQDADEARTVKRAGTAGCVTVATNMAGRGTDIRCESSVISRGGLHVINLELNDSRRIDRQLHGRAARQGEPGSCQDVLCLDDAILKRELNVPTLSLLRRAIQYPDSAIMRFVANTIVRIAQSNVESRYRHLRLTVKEGQTRLQRTLAIGGYGD